MTSNSDKLRSLILAALMVFSVFAGTVALTGSAAAAGGNNPNSGPGVSDAKHYVGNNGPVLEVSFDEVVEDPTDGSGLYAQAPYNTNDGAASITVTTEDGDDTEIYNSTNISTNGGFSTNYGATVNNGQLRITTPNVVSDIDTVTLENILDDDNESTDDTVDVRYAPASANTTGDDVEIYRGSNVSIYSDQSLQAEFDIEGDGPSFDVTRAASTNSESYIWNTEDRDLGDYNITSGSDTVVVTLQDLGLEVNPDETSFDENENVTATVEMSTVDRFVEAELLDSNGDSVTFSNGTVDSNGEFVADFGERDPDNYTVEVTDDGTGVTTTSDSFEVVETGDAEADFDDNVYSDQRGDIVNITVEMSNTDEATIQIGQASNNGYSITADVIDENEDGIAHVEFNSFTAGTGENSVLTAGNGDTDVKNVRTGGGFSGNSVGDDILDATDYNMYVGQGTTTNSQGSIDGDDIVDARATLSLSEATIDNVQIWTAPDGSDLFDADAEDIPAYDDAGNLTTTDVVANGDTLVVQVNASGLEGALDNRDGSQTMTELYTSVSGDGPGIFNLTFEGESIPNAGPQETNIGNLSNDNLSVLYDDANDSHYVVINSENLTDNDQFEYEDGDSFTANFTVFEQEDGLVGSDTFELGEFDIEDPEAELRTDENDEIVLGAAAGQEVTGDTNLAPGTDMEIELDSDSSGDPFVIRPEATVQQDGTFTGVADLSENDAGSEFTAEITDPSGLGDEYDGRLVEASEAPGTGATDDNGTATPDDGEGTPADGEGTPADGEGTSGDGDDTSGDDEGTPAGDGDESEMTEGGEATETATTGGSGPGFTAALALIALVAAALLAVRRNN